MNLQYPDLAALLLRVGFGGFMLFGHGMGKLRMLFSDGAVKFPEVLEVHRVDYLLILRYNMGLSTTGQS